MVGTYLSKLEDVKQSPPYFYLRRKREERSEVPMSTMSDWAKNEVMLACRKENPDWKEGEWDYGCSCYQSALKAYLSLMKDGHSGFSFAATRNILEKLLYSTPLTPIEDIPEEWEDVDYVDEGGMGHFQCKRRFSLFKYISQDGKVFYRDNNQYVCKLFTDEGEQDGDFHCKVIEDIMNEMYPITMPYMPEIKPYTVVVRPYLTDRNNGDIDTLHVVDIRLPNGGYKFVGRFFKEDPKQGWVEIQWDEFEKRFNQHYDRIGKEELKKEIFAKLAEDPKHG